MPPDATICPVSSGDLTGGPGAWHMYLHLYLVISIPQYHATRSRERQYAQTIVPSSPVRFFWRIKLRTVLGLNFGNSTEVDWVRVYLTLRGSDYMVDLWADKLIIIIKQIGLTFQDS